MKVINPYLNFKGTTEAAFNFYKSIFGGEFYMLVRFGDSPGCDGMSPEDKNKLMHISLPLSNGSVLMGTDVTGAEPFAFREGNNISLSIHADSLNEGKSLFASLSNGGQVVVPFDTASWGGYFGMLTDAFGIQWMITFDENRL
jgi:PhnB protein